MQDQNYNVENYSVSLPANEAIIKTTNDYLSATTDYMTQIGVPAVDKDHAVMSAINLLFRANGYSYRKAMDTLKRYTDILEEDIKV